MRWDQLIWIINLNYKIFNHQPEENFFYDVSSVKYTKIFQLMEDFWLTFIFLLNFDILSYLQCWWQHLALLAGYYEKRNGCSWRWCCSDENILLFPLWRFGHCNLTLVNNTYYNLVVFSRYWLWLVLLSLVPALTERKRATFPVTYFKLSVLNMVRFQISLQPPEN